MLNKSYISVIVPLKLDWEPVYSVPEGQEFEDISIGDRVKVSFANREYIGTVCATNVNPDTDSGKIRQILSWEREMGKILPEEIMLWREVAEYYLCSIGEVYKAAYPYGKTNMEEARASARLKAQKRKEKLIGKIRSEIERLQVRCDKKRQQISKARKESSKEAYITELEKLETAINDAVQGLKRLESRQDIESAYDHKIEDNIVLSPPQTKAYNEIISGFSRQKPVLLHGITGSGKTEIYIKLALETLSEGKNVLYLIPEIAIGRQLEDRLLEHFGNKLMTFHSAESAVSRRNTAETIRSLANGQAKGTYMVLGTRSSLFLPHHNLGLIIVDEEHDNSYKQDSPSPRYNGRDTALMLSGIHKCKTILGSATPSLEELYNCHAGKHVYISLKERFHGSDNAEIVVIDTKAERMKRGMQGNFSRKLIDMMAQTLKQGEQIMILRSRRAWAPLLQCSSCGEISKCPHCNVSLSFHKTSSGGIMSCHYCGFSTRYTGQCARCHGSLTGLGSGTQKIEEETAALFPGAKIARLDSDSAQDKNFEQKTIRDFSKGEIDILIGTQMVTKGFDFSNLTLVAVIAADTLLGMQDFRADEKAFQILEQFRGRSGRRNKRGILVIQTSQPEHPVYQNLCSDQTEQMSDMLLLERKEFNFPPFTRILEVIIKDINENRLKMMAGKLRESLAGAIISNNEITFPYSPSVDKIADMHIRTIRISMKKDRHLAESKKSITETIRRFERTEKYEGHITIDVDPA